MLGSLRPSPNPLQWRRCASHSETPLHFGSKSASAALASSGARGARREFASPQARLGRRMLLHQVASSRGVAQRQGIQIPLAPATALLASCTSCSTSCSGQHPNCRLTGRSTGPATARGHAAPLFILHRAAPCHCVPVSSALGPTKHMYRCPSCNEATIAYGSKWLASSQSPAVCSACGAGCAIPIASSSGYILLPVVVATLAGFAALALRAAWLFYVGLSLAGFAYLLQQHTAPLQAVSARESVVAKRSLWVQFLATLFPFLFS